MIDLGISPAADAVIEVMTDHFPFLVETAEGRNAPNLLPDPELPNAWCKDNVGPGARMSSHFSLSIDTTKLWCHTWGTYGFKDENDAFAFKLMFG